MMDIALLTANASQLKHILAAAETHDYYLISLLLVGTSLTLQVIVGILLVVVGRWNINHRKEQQSANTTNNAIVILIFLITVINVLITAFDDDDDHVLLDGGGWSNDRRDLLTENPRPERSVEIAGNHTET